MEPTNPDALSTFVQRVRTRIQAFHELREGYFAAHALLNANNIPEANDLLMTRIRAARQILQTAGIQAPELYDDNELAKLFLSWETSPTNTTSATPEQPPVPPTSQNAQPSAPQSPRNRNSAPADIASMIDEMLEASR